MGGELHPLAIPVFEMVPAFAHTLYRNDDFIPDAPHEKYECPNICELPVLILTINVVTMLTVVLLEHVSAFEEEIRLIWNTRLSPANVFYVIIRYFTLVAIGYVISSFSQPGTLILWQRGRVIHATLPKLGQVVGPAFDSPFTTLDVLSCQTIVFVELASSTLILVLTDIILALRVWLLYHRSRKVLYFLVGLVTGNRGNSNVCWTILLSIIMFAMTLLRCRSTVATLGWRQTSVMSLFLRDGVFWFLAAILVNTVEIVLWRDSRASLSEIPVIPATSIMALIGARVLLNIKEVVTVAPHDTEIPAFERSDRHSSGTARA
ncbi:unnamed protein product [Mycena citricolor]|uniref:DUF6533 domain-containing protein n=1 Tax=Mycena citricolor TaxID=2018698 RepID=A0AAD2HHZ8_9AGAR|nr:unnamed protein product [Mycena citricolor]